MQDMTNIIVPCNRRRFHKSLFFKKNKSDHSENLRFEALVRDHDIAEFAPAITWLLSGYLSSIRSDRPAQQTVVPPGIRADDEFRVLTDIHV